MTRGKKPSTVGVTDTLPQSTPEPSKEPTSAPDASLSGLPRVSLDVFVAVSGQKPDQLAGFCSWAKRKKLAPRTIPEWKAELETFSNRPV